MAHMEASESDVTPTINNNNNKPVAEFAAPGIKKKSG